MTNDNAATKFLVQDLDLYYGKFQALKKINLDILGNINSLQTIENVQSELYDFLKEIKFD